MTRSPNRALIGAAGAFTVALFVFGSALVRALGTGADDILEPRPAPETPAPPRSSAESLDMDALMLAVENDPFQPDRTRPTERYRMPGDVAPEAPAPLPPPPPVPEFRLIGTVVFGPENGTAAIAVGDADPRMLSVGDGVMGYRLIAVTPQTATVSNGEREIMLRVPAPSSAIATTTRGNNGRAGANNGRGNAQPGRTPAQQAQLQQLMQRAAQGGALPQMLQQLQQLMSNGNAAGMAQALKILTEMSGRQDMTFEMAEDMPVQGGRVQVRPAPRRDSVVVRRPGGGNR